MDNQDKIFNRFKEAAENAATKDFPGMEKVWSRVEEKLDKKEDKKAISLWKKVSIAASLLLIISLGSQFLKTDKTSNIENPEKVVINEPEKESIQNTDSRKGKVAASDDSVIVSEAQAEKILQKPNVEAIIVDNSIVSTEAAYPIAADEVFAPAPAMVSGYIIQQDSINRDKGRDYESEKSRKRDSYALADSEKETQMAKKSAPLVIMNGRAISHSDDQKRDKMMQEELPNMNPENLDSLVILDEPLYIIDGIYYSENDLFGKNPTSPYAPLNKQEIKTITILQDLEATEKYGDRGKKGVVIITTKTGKPTPRK
jgi:hypothetical protein